MNNKSTEVAVGLSGGVDSSVTAALLKRKGFNVVGISMKIYDGSVPVSDGARHACYGPGEEDDIDAAEAVCKKLDIPFYVFDLRKEYRVYVIEYFRKEYLEGKTPNPCIVCNRRLKFGFLLERAREKGLEFQYFATGHYARIEKVDGDFVLKKAVDRSKDQTYFLYSLSKELLSKTIFPLGPYMKCKVREMAMEFGLDNANRPESQDFISCGDYSSLFNEKEIMEGDIVDEGGNVLGRHKGIIHYTIGQRKGLGLSSKLPLYVVKIDPEEKKVVVGGRENLFSMGLIAKDLNFLFSERPIEPIKIRAKIRLNHEEAEATLSLLENNRAEVFFMEPQPSVTPGQAVVFYMDDLVLGGGIIERPISES